MRVCSVVISGDIPCACASAHLLGVFLQHTEVGVRCRPPAWGDEDAITLAPADKCCGQIVSRALHGKGTVKY